ncbi:MAG TPA: VCBS domain-containing protein, partial [Mycobacterium sp.]|nr:VCBS domain-containing protein [Mycobacterium sp.]
MLAQVLQSGPTFIIRPAGPLNVLAEEVQKTPAELARELAVVQQMTSLQSVGQQIIQQFFQPNNDNNPNPQSNGHPHTQIQILFPTITTVMDETTHTGGTVDHVAATVTTTDGNGVPFGPTQIFDIPVPNGVTPPNAPAIIAADDRGAAAGAIVNGGSTNDPTPVIHVDLSGTNAFAGDAVELFNGTTAVGLPVLLTAANIAAGFVDITTPALADGAYHLNASITDAAGYTSPASNVADFTVDTVAPTLASIAPAAYTDTSAPDHFDATTGTLVGNDAAGAAALTYGIDGGAADTSHGGYNIAEAGTYGTLYVNSASGAYEFIPNDAAINSLSTAATEHFTVTATDPAGNKAHQDFAVTLTGANDAPVVVGNTSTANNHDLVNNLGGTAGFGENVLAANDDGSTPAIDITSVFGSEGLNFFGTHFT